MDEMSLSATTAACRLAQLRLVTRKDGRLMATARGELVCRAETEKSIDGIDVRVRAGALWTAELSKQWAALDVTLRS
jgi:hypothetical protein